MADLAGFKKSKLPGYTDKQLGAFYDGFMDRTRRAKRAVEAQDGAALLGIPSALTRTLAQELADDAERNAYLCSLERQLRGYSDGRAR